MAKKKMTRTKRMTKATRSERVANMTYDQVVDSLENKMSMSHVYQPLLIRALVDSGGASTFRQLAQVFLAQDESQLLYYENASRKCR
jgi:hypothetical protein